MAKENREHKDSVFIDLFHTDETARANLLELYNALYDTDYSDPSIIQYVGLENVLFKNYKNDLAFLVNQERIVLSEHQSTVNPNMPLRDLLYIAREYEKIVPLRDRYKSTLLRIPTPKFLVFYNGHADFPQEKILRLSDSFQETATDGNLELTVRVININPHKKHEILAKCPVLREYSTFIETVRKYPNDKAQLQTAVKECIYNGILADYLYRKSSEVINMLMAEYDYEMDIEVQREEAAEQAAAKAQKEAAAKAQLEADKKFLDHVDKLIEKMKLSPEEACQILEESYERYQKLKATK